MNFLIVCIEATSLELVCFVFDFFLETGFKLKTSCFLVFLVLFFFYLLFCMYLRTFPL